tara:strand:- start:353 stop:835 length:483 start_codon:yes stop_codon:yes gene_type:complete
MNKAYIIFILFFCQSSFALSVACQFEEVYKNGDVQQGIFLFNDGELRYEYNRLDLYTLLYVNKKLFIINNSERSKAQLLENQNNLVPLIVDIYQDYPNFKKVYKKNQFNINIEKNSENFIKRIYVNSNKINLSIYFINCQNKILDRKFFNFKPLFEYVFN